MLLGLLSDTHNSIPNLEAAIQRFRQEQVTTVIHCGDLTNLDMALRLVEFRVICTFGNGDWNANEILQNLKYYHSENYGGLIFRGEIDGVKVAATHGHLSGVVEDLANSGDFEYVFHGHSHRRRDEAIRFSRVINPGALGGRRIESRSFGILNLSTSHLETYFPE